MSDRASRLDSDRRPVDAPAGSTQPAHVPKPHLQFAGVTAVALALFVVTYLAFVWTEVGQRVENLALLGAEFRSFAEREAGLARLSQINVAIFALAIVAVFGFALVRRRGGLGSTVAASMVASVLAAELIKDVAPRPELVTGPVWILRPTFPSGTAAVATAIAVGAFLVAPDRLRWAVLPIGAIYAAAIGDAIQATGWHRFSDTIGSSLLVIAVAAAGLAVLARAGLVQPSKQGLVDRRIRNALAVLASVALLLGTVLLVLVAVFPLLTTPEGAGRAVLQTAFPLFGAGLTILALVLFAGVVEPYSLGRGRPITAAAPGPVSETTSTVARRAD
jgi:hypothetical protein